MPIPIKFGTIHSWVKEIKFCSNEGPPSIPRGDTCNNEIGGNSLTKLIKFLLKNHRTNINEVWHKTFPGEWDSGLVE